MGWRNGPRWQVETRPALPLSSRLVKIVAIVIAAANLALVCAACGSSSTGAHSAPTVLASERVGPKSGPPYAFATAVDQAELDKQWRAFGFSTTEPSVD